MADGDAGTVWCTPATALSIDRKKFQLPQLRSGPPPFDEKMVRGDRPVCLLLFRQQDGWNLADEFELRARPLPKVRGAVRLFRAPTPDQKPAIEPIFKLLELVIIGGVFAFVFPHFPAQDSKRSTVDGTRSRIDNCH